MRFFNFGRNKSEQPAENPNQEPLSAKRLEELKSAAEKETERRKTENKRLEAIVERIELENEVRRQENQRELDALRKRFETTGEISEKPAPPTQAEIDKITEDYGRWKQTGELPQVAQPEDPDMAEGLEGYEKWKQGEK